MAENSKPLKRVNSSEFAASGKLEDRETRGGKLEAGNSTITHLKQIMSAVKKNIKLS